MGYRKGGKENKRGKSEEEGALWGGRKREREGLGKEGKGGIGREGKRTKGVRGREEGHCGGEEREGKGGIGMEVGREREIEL